MKQRRNGAATTEGGEGNDDSEQGEAAGENKAASVGVGFVWEGSSVCRAILT